MKIQGKLLGLDSSAVAASCAVADFAAGGRILAYATVNTKTTHSQTLMPLMESVLKAAGLTPSDLDAFAVTNGPGSFTGLRIGVSAVKGLAFALGKPVCGVSTLKSLAHNLAGQDVTACAVMDARRGEVYNALFEIRGDEIKRLTEDRAISLADLGKELERYDKVVLVGDGAELAYEHFGGQSNGRAPLSCGGQETSTPFARSVKLAPEILRWQNAASVCFAAEDFISAKELMPIYLRKPQAERERIMKEKSI
jgi:tRNA threonylcarbamoyladenosine biosynthesis protein TsaB